MTAGRPKEIAPITCPGCGKLFQPPKKVSKYCTAECAHQYQHKAFQAMVERLIQQGLPDSAPAARMVGSEYYFTGVPCGRGHVTVRKVVNNICVDCHREKHQRECRERKAARIPKERNESLATVSIWLHILPDWRPVVVQRA